MKKRTLSIIAVLAIVLGIAGVTVWDVGNDGDSSGTVPGEDVFLEATLDVTDGTEPENTTDVEYQQTTCETTVETTTEATTVTQVTENAKPVAIESSSVVESSVYDPPFEKPDPVTPEEKLAKHKAELAEDHALAIRVNQQKLQLEAERAEIMASVGENEVMLSSAQQEEINRIDAALEELWFKHSTLIENPNYFEYEEYFLRFVQSGKAGAEWDMQYEPVGSKGYNKLAKRVEMYDTMQKMYNSGVDIDSIYIYFFTCMG